MEHYKIKSRVEKLEFKTRAVRAFKANPGSDEVTFVREDVGWFVTFDGSYESLFVGVERPTNLDPMQWVEIIIKPISEPGGSP